MSETDQLLDERVNGKSSFIIDSHSHYNRTFWPFNRFRLSNLNFDSKMASSSNFSDSTTTLHYQQQAIDHIKMTETKPAVLNIEQEHGKRLIFDFGAIKKDGSYF